VPLSHTCICDLRLFSFCEETTDRCQNRVADAKSFIRTEARKSEFAVRQRERLSAFVPRNAEDSRRVRGHLRGELSAGRRTSRYSGDSPFQPHRPPQQRSPEEITERRRHVGRAQRETPSSGKPVEAEVGAAAEEQRRVESVSSSFSG